MPAFCSRQIKNVTPRRASLSAGAFAACRHCIWAVFAFLLIKSNTLALAQDGVPPLDEQKAAMLAPYSWLACEAYGNCRESAPANSGYRVAPNWKDAAAPPGVSSSIRSLYQQSDFSATVYLNDRTKEIVIAYRGTDDSLAQLSVAEGARLINKLRDMQGDWATNIQALNLKSPQDRLIAQYVQLARLHQELGQFTLILHIRTTV